MSKGKLKMHLDKHLLIITNPEGKQVRFDLLKKRMEKLDKWGNWNIVQQQYEFFRNYEIADLECDNVEEAVRFRELILVSNKINPLCESLSTFLSRMGEALVYENYIRQGIKTECRGASNRRYGYSKEILTKPLEFYHKYIIAFFKKYDIEVTCKLETAFKNDYELMSRVVLALDNIDISAEDKKEALKNFEYYHTSGKIKDLATRHNYDLKALFKYVYDYLKPFENIKDTDAFDLLKDYCDMCSAIGRNFKKYPHYLKSMHDIISANYQASKRTYDELAFERLAKRELEYEEKEYCIKIPMSSKEVIQEGTELSHCVHSYVDKILKKQTYIFFMRNTEKKEESLITLEYMNGKIVQAKGHCNRPCTSHELEFLKKYSKIKEVPLEISQ